MGPFEVGALGILTGLVFVAGSLAVVLVVVLAQIRTRRVRAEMLHRERMLAIEKGIPIPPDYLEVTRKRRPYVSGLIWSGIGLALLIWGLIGDDKDLNGFGLVPLFIGIALLVGDAVSAKKAAPPKISTEAYREAPAPYRAPDNPS